MDCNEKGEIAETKIIAKFKELGYDVYIPIGHAHKIDLLIVKEGKVVRVQSRCAEHHKDSVKISFEYNRGSKRKGYYTSEMVDLLVAYDLIDDVYYFIPSSEFGKAALRLRLTEPKNGNQFEHKFAKDYLNLPC